MCRLQMGSVGGAEAVKRVLSNSVSTRQYIISLNLSILLVFQMSAEILRVRKSFFKVRKNAKSFH